MESTLSPVAQLRADLSHHHFHSILAFNACTSEPAGFTLYTYNYTPNGGRYLDMVCIHVREAYRGRGLATMLMGVLAGIAQREGLCKVRWEVREGNTGARGFYTRLGAVDLTEG